MPETRNYHRQRKLVEDAMSTEATCVVAKIAHHKLALLHEEAADRADADLIRE